MNENVTLKRCDGYLSSISPGCVNETYMNGVLKLQTDSRNNGIIVGFLVIGGIELLALVVIFVLSWLEAS
jgi:hypothetical protein